MIQLIKKLILVTIFVSSILAHADFSLEPIYEASKAGNFGPVTTHFSEAVSKGEKPLIGHEDRSGIFWALYELLILQPSNENIATTKKLIRQAIQLGGDPTLEVVFEGNADPFDGLPLTAVDIILNEWIRRIQLNDPKKELFVNAARIMFDIWFETGVLEHGFQVIQGFQGSSNYRKVGFIHRVLMETGETSIIEYFLTAGLRNNSLDEDRWNMAMVAVVEPDIEALRTMRRVCGAAEAAALFNYQCDIRFKPTVLHASIQAVRHAGADRVYEVINYLTQNGADPMQRSVYHSLIDEVDFWSAQEPQHIAEYNKLRTLLQKNMATLVNNYQNACAKILGEG